MDTKLKGKSKGRLKILLIIAACATGCSVLFYLMDNVFNGILVEWFEKNFMGVYYDYTYTGDGYSYYHDINWSSFKILIFICIGAAVAITVITAVVSSKLYAKKKVGEALGNASRMMREYIEKDIDAADIFPADYAEISAQMSEIKADMSRSEQIIKSEVARKNDLIASLAHDLKTPLTSVIGYLSLLDEAPDMPTEQKAKYVKISLDKAMRLESLINEFFEITRYNSQQITLIKEPTDIGYMLIQMSDEFYPSLKAHGNTISLNAEDDLTANVDSEKLARVFSNLLKNAVSYSYPDTVISISAKKINEKIEIRFINSGKVIPKQKLDMIFERFFRADEARNANTGGAGLGLAIAKEIISLHGGTITAKSENALTEFTVILPAGKS